MSTSVQYEKVTEAWIYHTITLGKDLSFPGCTTIVGPDHSFTQVQLITTRNERGFDQ